MQIVSQSPKKHRTIPADVLPNDSEAFFCKDEIKYSLTTDRGAFFDGDLELVEFLNEFYSLKHHKSPGYDGITNDDFASLIPIDSPSDESNIPAKLASLKFILNIIESLWFNESVPRL